jgi:excisionase family DNA binding protein
MAMLTPKAAAERLGVSPSLIYQLCNEGVLPSYRFGGAGKRGRVMVAEPDLEAYIDRCRHEATANRLPLKLKHINM